MNTMTLDQMLSKLKKDMDKTGTGNNFTNDWLNWVGKNKVFKLKTIPIDSVSPADGWRGDQNKIDNMAKSDLNNAPLIVVHKNGAIIDGNHRHQAVKKQGAQTIQAYVGEDKMELDFIDNEITEGRLFRTSRNYQNLTGRDVADLFYLTTLAIYIMEKDSKQSKFARAYAKRTTQYGPYALFRTHATDLYLLGYVVDNPNNDNVKLKNHIPSVGFLNSIKLQNRRHWNFISRLGRGDRIDGPVSFFIGLENQLKIKDNRYKSWRRLATDWQNTKFRSRQYVIAKITQEFRRIGVGSEMMTPLQTMTKYRSYQVSDKYKKKASTGRKVAGAVAGAVAGRYAGKKIAQKFGKDIDKYKKAGTGIGAIAGYWAGGRQKQS